AMLFSSMCAIRSRRRRANSWAVIVMGPLFASADSVTRGFGSLLIVTFLATAQKGQLGEHQQGRYPAMLNHLFQLALGIIFLVLRHLDLADRRHVGNRLLQRWRQVRILHPRSAGAKADHEALAPDCQRGNALGQ